MPKKETTETGFDESGLQPTQTEAGTKPLPGEQEAGNEKRREEDGRKQSVMGDGGDTSY